MMIYECGSWTVRLAAAVALTACGGGGGGGEAVVADAAVSVVAAAGAAPGSDLVSTVIAPAYPSGSMAKGAWTLLMAQRSSCGFGLLQQDTRLDTAAAAHAGYLTQNSVARSTLISGHNEDSSLLGFYATTPSNRAAKAGYPNQVAEILTEQASYYPASTSPPIVAGEALGASSMLQLLETIYHLSTAMYPGRTGGVGGSVMTGAWTTPGYNQTVASLVADIGADASPQKLGTNVVATWPCNGVTAVTGKFAPAFESPAPFADVTSTSTVYGTPIYFKADSGSTLSLSSATIAKAGDATLATRQLTHANDTNGLVGTNEAFIVPTAALQAASSYTVTASGTVNGTAFSKQFSFSTAP